MVQVTESFVLSNLDSTTTGIEGAILWVSAGEFSDHDDDVHQGPRVLVVVGDDAGADCLKDAVAVLITDPPEVMASCPPRSSSRSWSS